VTRYLRLITTFISISVQPLLAYRANFWLSLFHSLLNLVTGWLALTIVFEQMEALNGWDYPSALAVLGVYLIASASFHLVIAPGLEDLAGMDGEIWTGKLDFVLLRPINTQFYVSLRKWGIFSLFDVLLGLVVTGIAITQLAQGLAWQHLLTFIFMLGIGLLTLYAIFLFFSSLVFWSPGFRFTWIFYGLMEVARFPITVYPTAVRFLLTWIIPLGLVTTIPAQALTGQLTLPFAVFSIAFAGVAFLAASTLFRVALRRYASASS
jgi:ABC-2 type transport system permease protein